MITVIAKVLAMMLTLIGTQTNDAEAVIIPPMPMYAPDAYVAHTELSEWSEWFLYRDEAYWEYTEMFDALYLSVETKRAKNGRLMVKSANGGSFKFTKKG